MLKSWTASNRVKHPWSLSHNTITGSYPSGSCSHCSQSRSRNQGIHRYSKSLSPSGDRVRYDNSKVLRPNKYVRREVNHPAVKLVRLLLNISRNAGLITTNNFGNNSGLEDEHMKGMNWMPIAGSSNEEESVFSNLVRCYADWDLELSSSDEEGFIRFCDIGKVRATVHQIQPKHSGTQLRIHNPW